MTHQTCRFVTVAFILLKFKIIYDQYGIILTNDMNLICTNTCIYFVKMIQKSSTVDIPRLPNTYLIVAKTREMFVTLFHRLQTVVCLQFNNTLIIVKYSH